MTTEQAPWREYRVWDRTTRWFHWINVLAVLSLIAAGLVILYSKQLGLSLEGKAQMKTVHALIGYVFVVNLCWRLIWAFIGGPYARWRAILPVGAGHLTNLKAQLSELAHGREPAYAGHSPLARIAISVLLLLLVVMAITGLVLAGTDLFYPPFGHWFAQQVAASGVNPASLGPSAVVIANSPELIDATAYADMRSFRKLFGITHLYSFYALLIMIVLHIAGVVFSELRGGGSLVSAMFTGRKILRGEPADDTGANTRRQ